MRGLSIGRTLRVALIALTFGLGLVAALGIGALYDARQDYEDELARAYELQAGASRLLAAAVIEEGALRRRDGSERSRAAATFNRELRFARAVAADDAESLRIVSALGAAERSARRAAERRSRPGRPDPLASALAGVRALSDDLVARQSARRAEARDEAGDRTRRATITAAVAGALALLAALALVAALVNGMRRPLDELVGATRRLSQGDLHRRVHPGGPRELRDLGESFNRMAADLDSAQRRIEAERRKLEVTVESLGDALVTTDRGGVVTSANPRAADLVPALVPGARAAGGDSPLPPVEDTGAGEVVIESGGRTLAVTAAPLGDEGGTVWTIRDISERARLERLKSEFVATASHELRSPLTSIKGFAELLSRSRGLDDKQREFIDVIVLSTNRLVDLVNDLLEVARAEAGKIELHRRAIDIGEQVREIATLMRPRLDDKRQTLDLDVAPNLPRAYADPARVRQILTNLITNAHLYTDAGGRLSVSVDTDGAWLVLEVSDTGRGMTPEEVEHAFDRFYRGEHGGRSASGTGLGLSIVRSLVELHEGTIAIASDPGVGTTFSVRLPREPVAGMQPAPRLAIRGKRILVVDDEPAIGALIARQLEPYDVASVVVTSGAEAVERLRNGMFDAVTLDLFMPGMSGFEVLRAIRSDERLADMPVVVVSVLSSREVLAGEWTVSKPIDSEELADALGGAVLAGRTRVLAVGRAAMRARLAPTLERLGLAHTWVTTPTAAATASESERYEVALVDAGMKDASAALEALTLRGRRMGRRVILFSDGDDVAGLAALDPEPVSVDEAAQAVLDALSGELR